MFDRAFKEELLRTLREGITLMAALDADVQQATTLLNDAVIVIQSLQAQLAAAGGGVPAADQTALETAIAAATPVVTPVAPAPAPAPAPAVATSPEVA